MVLEVEATSQLVYDGGKPMPFINQTEVANDTIAGDASMREVAATLSRWVNNARNATNTSSMFDRAAYAPPRNIYDEMRAARYAVEHDDIVSGTCEITEAFAFEGVKWESADADDADAFNQLAIEMNLDDLIRKMWHDEFTYSQFYATKIWGWCDYVVRGKTSKGNKRKKSYRFWAPKIIRTQNPLKIVPVGQGPLAGEQLAWQATPGEINAYENAYRGDKIDPLMLAFFEGQYLPDIYEQHQLVQLGVIPSRLLIMNPEFTFRHTLTKPDYERFPNLRLKSLFHLLDLKQQLITADRATLIGAATYILLIRKGTKEMPAKPEEMKNLRENYNFLAKLPVIISDHRLEIDIIAPKVDFVLQSDRYDVLDARIRNRLLGTLIAQKGQGRSEKEVDVSVSVARVMQNRRHMLRRTLEREISQDIVNHPRNGGVFGSQPNLVYTPRNIALAMDPAYAQGLLALRTQREISRETILEYWGLDETAEAMRMETEAEFFDDIFMTQVPYTAEATNIAAPPSLGKPGDPSATSTTGGAPGGAPPARAPAKAAPAKATTKDGPNRKGPAGRPASGMPSSGRTRTGPNGTPEAPAVSGRRGGRPVGGGTPKKSAAATGKPKTARGNTAATKASEHEENL